MIEKLIVRLEDQAFGEACGAGSSELGGVLGVFHVEKIRVPSGNLT